MSTITVIMLNFRRRENVPRILDALSTQTVKPTIWLWNNGRQPLRDARVDMEVVADRNWHCWPRWFLASYATTDHVMMIDDDIVPACDRMLEAAIDSLEGQDAFDTIVGAEGVVLGPARTYWHSYPGKAARSEVGSMQGSIHVKKVVADIAVDIVKGRCLVVRTAALKTLPLSPAHRDTCDDIAVSGLLARGRSRAHLVSAALGRALDDIPDTEPSIALSSISDWRDVRELAKAHYFGASETTP